MFATRRRIPHVSITHGLLSRVSGLAQTTLTASGRRSFGISRHSPIPRTQVLRKRQENDVGIVCCRSRFSTISFNDPIEYQGIEGVEPLALYEPGGYHPVMVDDLLHRRYRIVDKLGHGGYSTIWLAHDEQTRRYVALKIGISGQMLPRREPSILRTLSQSVSSSGQETTQELHDASTTLPEILDVFNVRGPNGIHVCYTKTLAQGNLKEASFSRLFPIEVARLLAGRLALAVSLIHSRGFVHGGGGALYLGRMAEEFTADDARGLILGDFGEAFAPATEDRLGGDCNTPVAMRAPEALFEPDTPVSYSADVWSLGTAIWEILGMGFIFDESASMDEIVAQQIDILGAQGLPQAWREHWERPQWEELVTETEVTVPRRPADGDREAWPPLEQAFEVFVQRYRREQEAMGVFGEEETRAILELMRGMLRFRPEERMTIQEVLRSEWMTRWALPRDG
ncbi:kinase domain protein [Apiospora marii]|uniref:kinase domain protein n=1 Tax=Apiospora marii TaxID=335849 RepID=UPI00312E554D